MGIIMAVTPQIKANQLIKDLNIKSKDMSDIMAEKGLEFKAQKALEPIEFEAFFDAITLKYQIEGIDDYIDGVTFIPSKLEKKAKKPDVEEKKEPESEKAVTEAKNESVTEKSGSDKKASAPKKEEKKAEPMQAAAAETAEKTENKDDAAATAEPVVSENKKQAEPKIAKPEEKPKGKTEEKVA